MTRKLALGALLIFLLVAGWFAIQEAAPTDTEGLTEWVSFEEAFEIAQQDNKLLLLDIYEVGCKFCREMEETVYPSPAVKAIIEQSYVPVRIDGNSDTPLVWRGETIPSSQFAQEMGVSAYPYTVIMTPEGQVLDSKRGFLSALEFSQLLRQYRLSQSS
jgi:thioredoxin-related protein